VTETFRNQLKYQILKVSDSSVHLPQQLVFKVLKTTGTEAGFMTNKWKISVDLSDRIDKRNSNVHAEMSVILLILI